MPIDPNISLGVRPPQIQGPMQAFQQGISIADMLAQLNERRAQASAIAEEAPLRRLQIAAQTKQLNESNALNSAFENSVSYDPNAGDLTYDDTKAAQTLQAQGMSHLLPQYQAQKEQRLSAHRTQAINELTTANQKLKLEAVPAENFLGMEADKKKEEWPNLRVKLLTTDPSRGKVLPYDYDPVVVDKQLQQLVDAHEQTKDVADKLDDAQKKENLQKIQDKKLSVEDLWKKYGGVGAPTPQFRNAVIAKRADVQAPSLASYVDKPVTTKTTPGHRLPYGAIGVDGEIIPDEQKIESNSFQEMRRGSDGTQYWMPVAGAKPIAQQVKDAKVQAAYAMYIGKNVTDLDAMDKVKADTWYANQLPAKKTEIDKRLEIFEKSPQLYQDLFGHGGPNADKPVNAAQRAAILGRINAEITKQGLSGKEADDFKKQRFQELKDAGIDMAPPAPKPAPGVKSYDTTLTPDEEVQFQAWKAQYAPNDSGGDYDLRGAFKAGLKPGPNGHWPDTFKKPNHPTFSNESKYAVGADAAKAGRWTGPNHDQFVPPSALPHSGKTTTRAAVQAQADKRKITYDQMKAIVEANGITIQEK